MKNSIRRMKSLSGIAFLALAISAHGLTIIPTFDSSITSDPNAAAMEAAINAAIQVFESNYTDNVTVHITYVNDPTVGLGQSETYFVDVSYSSYRTALKNKAADANDTNALTKLPTGSTDPVIGGSQVGVTTALYRCLGLGNTSGPGGLDSTISLNTTIMNLTRPPTNSGFYDMQAVVSHETDEALGTSSALPSSSPINAMDLFRYDTNLNRSFTTSGDNAYFSVDGTNLWARFNQGSDGDYGDWWSTDDIYWAPPGVTPFAQVQDAFAQPGIVVNLGVNEFAMLDAVGWTLSARPPTPTRPVLTIARATTGHVKLSWPTNSTPFALQETTNLSSSNNWVASATGTNNPATILASATKKFYRLSYQLPLPEIVTTQPLAVEASTNVSLRLVTRSYRPHKP